MRDHTPRSNPKKIEVGYRCWKKARGTESVYILQENYHGRHISQMSMQSKQRTVCNGPSESQPTNQSVGTAGGKTALLDPPGGTYPSRGTSVGATSAPRRPLVPRPLPIQAPPLLGHARRGGATSIRTPQAPTQAPPLLGHTRRGGATSICTPLRPIPSHLAS